MLTDRMGEMTISPGLCLPEWTNAVTVGNESVSMRMDLDERMGLVSSTLLASHAVLLFFLLPLDIAA